MEKSINLDFKFNVEPKANFDQLSSNVAFQIASTRPAFSIDEIKSLSATTFQYEMSDADIANLKKVSTPISKTEFELNDECRSAILKTAEPGALSNVIKKIKKKDTIQKHIYKYLDGKQPPLEQQTPEELVKTLRISKWFKGSAYAIPAEEEVLSRLHQHEILRPFQALTRFFRGRKSELASLSDYVDWLPKEGFIRNTASILRNVIRWHEKPPLLLLGIGGIGKSSIIAKFILENVTNQARGLLPYVYFDFDKPGFSPSQPYLLVSEALRQLAIQFPARSQVMLGIRKKVIEIFGEAQAGSSGAERSLLYEMLLPYRDELNNLGKPVLVVFDSFEEVEYRISKSQMMSLFDFLEELSAQIPRIRFVFAGRSDAGFEGRRVDKLIVRSFDEESALGFLENLDVKDPALQKDIFKKVGGNPLTLHLAADLVRKQRDSIGKIKTSEFYFAKLDENLIQKQLVERNLNHIHNSDVRKIAVPGMLVRKIDPQIIKDVLAKPCGLKNITTEEAAGIFENIQKETFLVERSGDGLKFRQDLRVALYDLIQKKDPEKCVSIHNNAVAYYANKTDAASVAEYLYHRLKRGDTADIIHQYYNAEVATYLDYSISELPIGSQLILSSLKGGLVRETKAQSADNTDWEVYTESLLMSAFIEGDEPTLRKLQPQVEQRKERSGVSLLFLEAKLYLRLLQGTKFLAVMEKLRTHRDFGSRPFHYSRLMISYYEYEGDFKRALQILEDNRPARSEDPASRMEYFLTAIRLCYRVKDTGKARHFISNLKTFTFSEPSDERGSFIDLFPQVYRAFFTKQSHFDAEIFAEFLDSANHLYQPGEQFRSTERAAAARFHDLNSLEKYVYQDQHILLRNLSEPGAFRIVLHDVMIFYEISGRISGLSNDLQKIQLA